MWEMFLDYHKLMEYLVNVSVVNDLTEMGMHLISKCEDKEERQALLQVVEQHRKEFKDFDKKTLARL